MTTVRQRHGRTGQTDERLTTALVGAYARGPALAPRVRGQTRDTRQTRLTTNQPASQSDSTKLLVGA